MNRPGWLRIFLFADLLLLIILVALTALPIIQTNRLFRLEQTLLRGGAMAQSEHLNRVAFAMARFALVSALVAGEAGPGATAVPADQMEPARSLASHAVVALDADLRTVTELLEKDPLLLRRRLRESREAFAAATEQLVEAYERLEQAGSGEERIAAMSVFRQEAADFFPVVENRSRILMQLEATIGAQLRANQSSVFSYLRLLFSLQLATAVLLALLVVLVVRSQLTRVRALAGLIPICSKCKKVRNDEGYWNQVEEYVSAHSEADFSHSLCPDCLRELYPDFASELDEAGSTHR